MTDYPQWSTVKAELDDPSVSAADKQRLLNDYAAAAAYGNPFSGTDFAGQQAQVNPDYVRNMPQILQYAQKYGSTDAFTQAEKVNSLPGFVGPKVVNAEQAAGQAAFQQQQQRVRNDQLVGTANTTLTAEAKKTVAQGGTGASTSDEILDPGSRGLLYFQYFIPPYRNWTGSAPDLANDIQKVYDNLRGINFAVFRADATQLATSHGKLSDSTLNLSTATNSLGGFWQGSAAQAAQQYCNTFIQNARTVTDGTTAAGQLITDQMKAIETAVLQRSQAVLKMYASDIGGFSPSDIQQIIDAAKLTAGDDELRSMAKWNVFSNVDWGDTNCNGSLSQNVKNLASMDATNWLNTQFTPNFNQKKSSFDSITSSTHATVGTAFDAMNTGLGKIDANPFSDLSAGIQVPGGTGSPAAPAAPGGSSGGSSSSGGGPTAPSGYSGGSSGAPSGGAPTPTIPSTAPTTPTTTATPTMPTLPSGTDPGGSTVPTGGTVPTGSTIPSGSTVPTGTVPSGTVPGTPETLTVQHGDSTLTVSGPDSQGDVQLTTQDGSGQPQNYDIGFGTTGTDPTGTDPTDPTTGTDPTTTGPDGVQHITPGADGKAVIHDGNTTITAQEQPNGQVRITVDDGSGQPTTYTLGPAGTASQPPTDPGATPVDTSTPVDTTAAAQPVDYTTQQSGFTDPSATQTGFTAPSTYNPDYTSAAYPSTSDTSGLTPAAGLPQTTELSSVVSAGHAATSGGGPIGSAFAQGFADPSSGLGNALGGVVGGGHATADQLLGAHHDLVGGAPSTGHAGVAGTDVTPIGPPGDAGLASAPPGALDQSQDQSGGMPMMGGMGGGGGTGGDGQRGANQWRTNGRLFEDLGPDEVVGRFSGTLDDSR